MRLIKNFDVIPFDCDDTLIYPNGDGDANNVAALRRYKKNGFFVIVWSRQGWNHAMEVVQKLGLVNDVDLVINKPKRYVDDEWADTWMQKEFHRS